MSIFIDIVCYDSNGPDGGNIQRLTKGDLVQLAERQPKYKVLESDGTTSIRLSGVHVQVVLQPRGMLSCQLDHQTDTAALLDALRDLASHLLGAVVQDEEGEIY
ncbi:hypothetical protein [Aeoliella sp.]|uniref:hypothetical protein n=1 Tax=Aeoliella sp. TaxID=2795800 RepID=UPI003CCB7B04